MTHHVCITAERWPEYDARGIFLTYVCPLCINEKLAAYRPEVLADPSYIADEPIEPESETHTIPMSYFPRRVK